jgi:asparagine synthase (glutamine-hydrolysing)
MCGIAGFWADSLPPAASDLASLIGRAIEHRGPDTSGFWKNDSAGILLIHRRLAIVDLSPTGVQPMGSVSGRYIIVFNGEIYNHRALRKELEFESISHWRGHSDTETLLAIIEHWGLHQALERCIGMFAFALWDQHERKLVLARDRIGEKPLYFGHQGSSFLFASELKALRAHPDWSGEINRDAITLLMRHNYIGAPHCIYRGMQKLLPGHYIEVTENGRKISEPQCYWSLEASISLGQEAPFNGSPEEAVDTLEALLKDAVRQQMEADVPLGAFLSGGYDSSLIVAMMQAQTSRPIRTFTIGFHETGYDEAACARAVAKHLGTEHTELYVSARDAVAVIPRLPKIYDEPFADSSQIPTYLVSALARQHVTVSLSGDGGDELFCGYGRYALGHTIWQRLRRLPAPLRYAIGGLLRKLPARKIDQVAKALPPRMRPPAMGDRLNKLGDVLEYDSGEAFYRTLVSHHKTPTDIVLNSIEPATPLTRPADWPALGSLHERMMYLDTKTYLPDDILTKVDRAAMAVSLETRVPFLDHRIVEFSHQLPLSMKLHMGQGKWITREVLYRYVPRALMDRPKMGFGVPIGEWLGGALRDWAEALLAPNRLKNEGYFNADAVRLMWDEHCRGGRRWHYLLWDILMFQAWLEMQRGRDA